MTLFKVNTNDVTALRSALISLCESDCDMNGENGPEFTWKKALDRGYSSNAEYLADKILLSPNLRTPTGKFKAFAEEFYRTNDDYYSDYDIEFLEDGSELTVAFSIRSRS